MLLAASRTRAASSWDRSAPKRRAITPRVRTTCCPPAGAARIRGGLSVTDYVKVISVQQLNRDALRTLAPAITTLARAEGLEAHARSVEVRTGD